MRKAVQITGAAVIAAVLMTGCSSQSDDKDKNISATPPASAPAKPADPAAQDPAKGTGVTGPVDGTYAAKIDGTGWGLVVSSTMAALAGAGHVCNGTVDHNAKPPTLTLKCADGDTLRTQGKIVSADGKALVVSWSSGKKDTFLKTEKGGAPAGLPDLGKLGH
ncbi:hypothetical protein ACFY1P_26945 [Streptomyces sp. NPDC001407]|uniref:hypothetical protein n=1 Tax=unclassified Streptomyces TaxID=2593676 RepID=UPI0033D9B794